MEMIEQTRKLIEDFLRPELREIQMRLEALERKTETRLLALETLITARFDAQDKLSAARHEALMDALTRLIDHAARSERLAGSETESEDTIH